MRITPLAFMADSRVRSVRFGQDYKLLLVEDDRDIRESVADILADEDFNGDRLRITAVSDGAQAEDELKRGGYDIFLTDNGLPRTDKGIQADEGIRLLKIAAALPKPPLSFMMSGDAKTLGTEAKALAVGAIEFFAKPFNPAHFLETIAQAISSLKDKKQAHGQATVSGLHSP